MVSLGGGNRVEEGPEGLFALEVMVHDSDEPSPIADASQQVACGRALGEKQFPLGPDCKGFIL